MEECLFEPGISEQALSTTVILMLMICRVPMCRFTFYLNDVQGPEPVLMAQGYTAFF